VQVRPLRTVAPYNGLLFPPAPLTVRYFPTGSVMRWTGLVSTDWNNPDNWVEVKTDYETPAGWSPAECVEAIISTEVTHFPELAAADSATCGQLTMPDRAMLKNPHALDYATAQVAIKLKPSERDRYVMWSAPLLNMISGDYHFKNSSALPQWGDVYMSLFQQANPHGGTGIAAANTFTATFGELGVHLKTGLPFNLRVVPTSVNKDLTWVFPQTAYPGDEGRPAGNKARLITDSLKATGTVGIYEMTVPANTGMTLIQVANPYLAYLDVAQFLSGNADKVQAGGYYWWDGDVEHGFSMVSTNGNRYQMIGSPFTYSPPGLIAPLQSFIVAKKDGSTVNMPVLKVSPAWTTTSAGFYGEYILRSAAVVSGGILDILVSQGSNKSSHAALVYDPEETQLPDGKDLPVAVYDNLPLTLYSFAGRRQAMAVNVAGDFEAQEVDLGIRIRDGGQTTLTFDGLPTFGHEVTLIDKQLGKETPLTSEQAAYTFTVAKSGSDKIEINDRFALRMRYTGLGVMVGNDAVETPTLRVYAENGFIHVRSYAGTVSRLQIYNVAGALVYSSDMPSDSYRIAASGQQVYIVKARIGDEDKVVKVMVK
jgi:hypothetical protein